MTPEEGKKYTKEQIKWVKRYFDAELRAVRQAVDKVDKTTIAKFDSVNEFRGQLKDQTATFVTRRELWGAVIATIAIAISIMQYLK